MPTLSEREIIREVPGARPKLVATVSDTRAFMKGWRRFFEERRDRHGSEVFWSYIAIPAVTILDVPGLRVLFDTKLVRKGYGFGPAIPRRDLVGTEVPTVFENGAPHDTRKDFLLTLIHRASGRLEPSLATAADRYLERWAREPAPFDWGDSADSLLAEVLFDWLLGARPDPRDVRTWVDNLLSPLPWDVPLPAAPAPAREARDRLLAAIREAPGFDDAAELARERAGLTKDQTASQLLFMLCGNAWGGLQGAWRSLMAEIGARPELLEGLHREARLASPGRPPGLADLARMPILRGAVLETLRLHGPVPFAYGTALTDLVIPSRAGTYRVRKGTTIQGVFWMAARDGHAFTKPDQFEATRYIRDPAAVASVLWANGPGDGLPRRDDKMCAGKDVVPLILELFAARLLWSWRFTLTGPPRWSDERIVLANRPINPLMVHSFTRWH